MTLMPYNCFFLFLLHVPDRVTYKKWKIELPRSTMWKSLPSKLTYKGEYKIKNPDSNNQVPWHLLETLHSAVLKSIYHWKYQLEILKNCPNMWVNCFHNRIKLPNSFKECFFHMYQKYFLSLKQKCIKNMCWLNQLYFVP